MGPTAAILVACAAAAARAHDISSAHHTMHPDFCQPPALPSLPLLAPATPMCANDTLAGPPLAAAAAAAAATTTQQLALAAAPGAAAWTRAAAPCAANAHGGEFCAFTSAAFARGRGIGAVTSPERAAFLARLPAFAGGDGGDADARRREKDAEPDDAGAPPPPPPFAFVHVPGKGMGVVATRPIVRGDHLMGFTPAVVIDYGAFHTLAAAEVRRLQTAAVDQLPELLRARFMNLSTHDGAADHEERIDKILKTNAFDVEINDENGRELYVVFPEISRFNHDCRPNADYWFDPESLVQHVYATRTIAPGEEISLSYMDPVRTRAKRQLKLRSIWGFQCSCSLCSQRAELSAASDQRIKEIKKVRKQLEDYTVDSVATPAMADLLVSLYEQERLDGSIYEAYTFAAIEWNGVGEPWHAMRYARLAIERGLAGVGPHDPDVAEMKALAENPWDHWTWMLRTRLKAGEKSNDA